MPETISQIRLDPLTDSRVLSVGRTPGNQKNLLCWTGSSLVFRARLREWTAVIHAEWNVNSPYAGVLVDGAPVARFALGRGTNPYTLLTGMDETVEHEFTLFRDTQPMSGETALLVRVEGMDIMGEMLDCPVKPVIECIGDSLTTGEGTVGPRDGMEWRSVWLSGMNTWAQTLCRALDVRGEWVSQSGWGLYTSWDNNRAAVLGAIYESAAAHTPYADERHDFAAHPVSAVVINLGTNDNNALRSLPEAERPQRLRDIQDAARDFLSQIHRCRPGTPVLFTYGMCGGELSDCLRRAVEEDAQSVSSPVAYLQLPECPEEELGSRSHPGARHQRSCGLLAAKKLCDMGVFPGFALP